MGRISYTDSRHCAGPVWRGIGVRAARWRRRPVVDAVRALLRELPRDAADAEFSAGHTVAAGELGV